MIPVALRRNVLTIEMPMKTTKEIANALTALKTTLAKEYGNTFDFSVSAKGGRIAAVINGDWEIEPGIISSAPEPNPITDFKGDPNARIDYGSGTVYKDADLAKFSAAISVARAMVSEDTKKTRDEGTCVLGAGIAIQHLAPRKRNAKRLVLMNAPFQGNVSCYNACKRAAQYLKSQGLDCYWYDGVMD